MKKFTAVLEQNTQEYKEVLDEIKKLVESTIEKSGGEFNQFLESFLKNPDDVKIEGLINEDDIFDFYQKFRNQVDKILNEVKFYQTPPDELNVIGLYDYMIVGTNRSIEEFVKILMEESPE